MGTCYSEKKEESKPSESQKTVKQVNKPKEHNTPLPFKPQPITLSSFPNLPHEYKDMEVYEDEKFIGDGVKKDKAYHSTLKIDEINSLRNEFWGKELKRYKGNELNMVKSIRTSCYVDHDRAKTVLAKAGVSLYNNSMKYCYDDKGFFFRVPNWCFNDPYVEKELKQISEITDIQLITIKLVEAYTFKEANLTISQQANGGELKELYMETIQEDIKNYKLRILCNGFEIEDDKTLFQYGIENNYNLQLVKNPI
mmetsp:Transcript_25328/g.26384  ORF Transcript_25328/g.26384 Transcript_25328/m.26384 type:complete len:253 (-) Transcript_25328:8-766(-)